MSDATASADPTIPAPPTPADPTTPAPWTRAADWTLRVAGPADLDAIMALETSTFESDAWSPAMMRADLAHKHCYYLVAENPGPGQLSPGQPSPGQLSPGQPSPEHPGPGQPSPGHPLPLVGYAGLLSPQGAADADIQTIAVAPDARGRGLGRRLMLALLAEAARRGARRVFLEVRADNPGAQHLYETLGFAPIGVRRGYYQPDNVDAVVMRLELSARTPPAAAVDVEAAALTASARKANS